MDVGDLFVKIRPDSAGFTSEAEGPMASAAKDLSKVFLAAFAVGGIAKTIESVVTAATQHQAAFALLEQNTRNAGASNVLYGKTLEKLLEQEARLKGFSDEELAQSFQQLVSVTHNSAQAFKDLQAAEDLARFRHIDLSLASLAVSKAIQGSTTALQRYGIVVPHASQAVDELKKAHDAAVAAGAKFSASQQILYKQALASAAATDTQTKKTEALSLIQERAGGSAEKFANTASGQFARAQQDFHQFEVTIGEALLPTLTRAAEGLGRFFTVLSKNQKVQDDAKTAAHDIGIAVGTLKTDFDAIAPPLITVVDDLGGLNNALGILGGLVLAGRINGALQAMAMGGVKKLGTEAETADGQVKGLAGSLGKLALIGAIGIPIVAHFEKLAPKDLGSVGNEIAKIPLFGAFFKAGAGAGTEYGKGFTHSVQALIAAEHPTAPSGSQLDESIKSMQAFSKKLAAAGIGSLGHPVPEISDANPLGNLLKGAIERAAAAALAEAKHNRTIISAGQEAIKSLREGITTDQTDLAQLKIDMADAVTQGAEAVNQAVESAKQNLNSIGQSLAGTIGTFIDKPLNDESQRLQDAQDRIAAQFDKLSATLQGQTRKLTREQAQIALAGSQKSLHDLGQEVLLPGGKTLASNPEKALAQLERLQRTTKSPALDAFVLQYRTALLQVQQGQLGLKTTALDARRTAIETGLQLSGDALKLRQDAAAHAKQQALTQIANLTDLLNGGAISEPAFDKALNRVLRKNHLSFVAAARVDGIAFADTFAAQLAGLGLQEGAIKAGPHRGGTGLIPSIVRPADTLAQVTKNIAGIASQERAKQLDESKKQTAVLKRINADQKASKFIDSLSKNPGGANKRSAALTGVGG